MIEPGISVSSQILTLIQNRNSVCQSCPTLAFFWKGDRRIIAIFGPRQCGAAPDADQKLGALAFRCATHFKCLALIG